MLTESIVEPAPEGFVLFLFNDSKDIAFSDAVLSFLRRFEAIGQMLLPMTLSMLSKVVTLLLTDQHAYFDLVYCELKWSIDFASPCSAA
jgi:hypothetical protein